MEIEEYLIVVGLLLILSFFIYPSETLSKTFCEGNFGNLGSYEISIQEGFLKVYHKGEEVFTVKEEQIFVKKANIKYSYSEGCYMVMIREKPEKALYLFVGGVILIGVAFYYIAFLRYR
ncbi:hypothetical protein EP1X_04265 [Thermococcus sp. EP1]|uniref:hypothetical protein n=1 Tax=Thermococcus sp. EP1 TaxID=1591054 RepID=UPI0006D97EF7|nr:hypothetical protein [Thermococcus sp. EP1]KPU63551.1 hypothetical protein EP1X_04265 [Thermococcus sp. EP1]